MNELALFAGAGGGILSGHLLGWRTVCAVERDAYAAQVLAQRQNDGILRPFPIWSDVCSFDGKPWRGIVDVVSGGFPCQDISSAGKGAGIDGARSGMWREMARIVGEVRPGFAFVENSPLLVGRGAAMVIGDLAEMGYDCQWCIVSASDCGAPHQRERFWLVANSGHKGVRERRITQSITEKEGSALADTHSAQRKGAGQPCRIRQEYNNALCTSSWWGSDPAEIPESGVGRMANGVAARVDRLKAIGNGQVPRVAATAFRILSGIN